MHQTIRRRLLLLPLMATMLLVSATAFAQTPGSGSSPVNLLTVVVMVATFLVGFFGNSVATDEILGQWKLNPILVPVFTLGGSFLAGALQILGPAAAAGTLSSAGLFVNALYSGAMALIAAAGGTAAHAHLAKVQAVKMAKIKRLAAKAAGAAAIVLGLGLLTASQTACTPATVPTLVAVLQIVEADVQAGDAPPQIDSDVCKALGGSATTDAICAGVTVLVQDALQLLLDGGKLTPAQVQTANAYYAVHPKATAPAVSR